MNRYFYIDSEGKQKGAFLPEELKKEPIAKDSLVWAQGMEKWISAADVAELQFLFNDNINPIDRSVYSPNYAQPVTNFGMPSMPKTWMIESILITILPFIFCCNVLSLLGIIAIVKAAQVEPAYMRGDYASALESSKDAGRWTKITFWISIGWLLILLLSVIFAIISVGSLAGLQTLTDTY